jgi:hypothetical protein
VTTTWNTSAADPKGAIARATALILAPQVCCKISKRKGPNAKPENSPEVVRGVHGRRLPIWHLRTIALTAELDRRTSSQCCDVRASWAATPTDYGGSPGPLVGYPFDNAAAHIVLSHAGGFVRYASYRFSELAHVCTPSGLIQRIRPTFSRASSAYDVVIPSVLPSLMAFAQEARILSGTQLPLRTRRCRCVFTAKLDAYDSLTADEHSAISHRNAGSLFSASRPTEGRSSRTSHRVIEAIGRDLRCQPSSPPRGIIKPWHCSTIRALH